MELNVIIENKLKVKVVFGFYCFGYLVIYFKIDFFNIFLILIVIFKGILMFVGKIIFVWFESLMCCMNFFVLLLLVLVLVVVFLIEIGIWLFF